ncbi:unnamed protein product [Calypogeia fissa]
MDEHYWGQKQGKDSLVEEKQKRASEEKFLVKMRVLTNSCKLFLLFFILGATLSTPVGATATNETVLDVNALLDFYSKIQDPLGKLSSWNASTSPCFWAGVGCNVMGYVVNLQLSGLGLRGTISPSIGNVVHLTDLDLSNNFLSGPIPDSVTNLTQLANFTAVNNNLSSTIPDFLGMSGSLIHLDLSLNFLTGSIPSAICQSTLLNVIALTNNKLTGSISPSINYCQTLERLFLAGNSLTGKIPDEVGQLPSLVSLDLSNNSLGGSIPTTFSQSTLTYLSFADNQLTGVIPAQLGNLGGLRRLLLNNNKFIGPIPTSLGNITNLEILDLSGNDLSEPIPPDLGKLSMMTTLTLRANRLSGGIPPALQGCLSLSDLELAENNLTGTIPAEIGDMSRLTYGLNLSFNRLNGPIPEQLGELQNLVALDLSHNQLEGHIPSTLGNMKSLIFINLAYNELNGSLPTFRQNTVNVTDFEGNAGLCGAPLPPCDESGNPIQPGKVHIWVPIVSGTGGALIILCTGIAAFFYWRLRCGYAPTETEPKAPSAEGCLFVDDEKPLAFNFEEVVDATQLISVAAPVGKGRYSTVYGVVMHSGQQIAVKKLKIDTENSSLTRRITSELHKIDKMRHPNLLRLLGYVLQGDSLLLLYNFCPNGSLGEWLHRKPESVLEWSTRYNIALGAAQGLAFLHHNVHPPFLHRDVNSNNILLDASFEPLLGDVGLAKLYDPSKETESMTAVAGSFGYIPPEYAYTMRVTEKSNVYSFGVVLLEMLSGKQPVDPSFGEGCDLVSWVQTASDRNETPEQLLDATVSTASFPVRQEMLRVLDIAKLCTSTLPAERPRMKVVVELLQKSKAAGVPPLSIQNTEAEVV